MGLQLNDHVRPPGGVPPTLHMYDFVDFEDEAKVLDYPLLKSGWANRL